MSYDPHMNRPDEDGEQQTPKGETIPVPTRKQVFDDLRRVARAPERPSDAGGSSPDDQ